MRTSRATAYEFGPYRVDSVSRSVLRLGEITPLPPKAVDVLLELVKQAGSVVRAGSRAPSGSAQSWITRRDARDS